MKGTETGGVKEKKKKKQATRQQYKIGKEHLTTCLSHDDGFCMFSKMTAVWLPGGSHLRLISPAKKSSFLALQFLDLDFVLKSFFFHISKFQNDFQTKYVVPV